MSRLRDVVSTGDTVESLKALRDKIAADIDKGVPARELASLSRRLVDIMLQIDGRGGYSTEDATFDELARRRAARGEERWQQVGRGQNRRVLIDPHKDAEMAATT
jgi:hypothetical protein